MLSALPEETLKKTCEPAQPYNAEGQPHRPGWRLGPCEARTVFDV